MIYIVVGVTSMFIGIIGIFSIVCVMFYNVSVIKGLETKLNKLKAKDLTNRSELHRVKRTVKDLEEDNQRLKLRISYIK